MSKRELPQIITDLQAIRDRLTNPEAWDQMYFGSEEGPNCLIGAMDIVIDRDYGKIIGTMENTHWGIEARDRRHKARNAICCCLPSGYDSLVRYNDDRETTHQDILTLIDAALESEKKIAGIVEYA